MAAERRAAHDDLGTEPPYFSSIGEVEWLSDGRIVVEDNQHASVYLFGADGAFVGTLADAGDGPGQLRNMTEMTVLPGDTVFLYDRRHRRLSVLHPDSGLVRTRRYGSELGGDEPLDVFALDHDRIVVQVTVRRPTTESSFPRKEFSDALLFLTDAAGELIAGPVTFPQGFSAVSETGGGAGRYSRRALVAVAPGIVVHGSGQEYDLTVRDSDFEVLRVIGWEGWSGPIPEEELEALHQYFLDNVSGDLPSEFVDQLEETWFSPHMLGDRRPALGWRSYVDEIGRIWVSKYFPDGLPGVAPEWHVLSPDGAPLGRLTLPAGTTLAAVADDRVMLIVEDDMDVQSLTMYGIER